MSSERSEHSLNKLLMLSANISIRWFFHQLLVVSTDFQLVAVFLSGMSMDELREYERAMQQKTNEKVATNVAGTSQSSPPAYVVTQPETTPI